VGARRWRRLPGAGADSNRRRQEKRQGICFHGAYLAGGKFYNPGAELAPFPQPDVEGTNMKWVNIYLIGYLIFLAGITMALWKAGVIDQIGTTWTAIGLIIAIGIGIMVAVANSGEKKTIEVDRT
jgi:hypothetical protein